MSNGLWHDVEPSTFLSIAKRTPPAILRSASRPRPGSAVVWHLVCRMQPVETPMEREQACGLEMDLHRLTKGTG